MKKIFCFIFAFCLVLSSVLHAAGIAKNGEGGIFTNGITIKQIKLTKFTGIVGASEGDSTLIAHGLNLSDVIGIDVLITSSNGNKIHPALVFVPEFQYDIFLTTTDIQITLSTTNSGNLLNGAIDVVILHE